MKLKVYIMHSDKINYKEELYKPLLEKGLMKDYFLILPLSKRFEASYIKELLNDSDLVICNLTKCNFFLKTEIKYAQKTNKSIYYLIDNNDKNKEKLKSFNYIIYNTNEELIDNIIKILRSVNTKELILKRDNIYCLGKIKEGK